MFYFTRSNLHEIYRLVWRSIVSVLLAATICDRALADTAIERAEIYKVRNQVDLNRKDATDWQRAQTGDIVVPQDSVRTGADSRAELLFNEGTLVRTAAGTIFRFPLGKRRFELTSGAALIMIRPDRGESTITTPEARIVTQGTALFVQHDRQLNTSLVGVLTESAAGLVEVKDVNGEVTIQLQPGQFVSIIDGVIGVVEHFVLPVFYETTELAVGLATGQEELVAAESAEVQKTLAAVRAEAVAPLQNQLAWLGGFCKLDVNVRDWQSFLQLFGISFSTEAIELKEAASDRFLVPLRSLYGLTWLSGYCQNQNGSQKKVLKPSLPSNATEIDRLGRSPDANSNLREPLLLIPATE